MKQKVLNQFFHPGQNLFEGSDEDSDDDQNEDVPTQNQVSPTTEVTGPPRTVAQRHNQGWLFWTLSIPFLPFRFASSIVSDLLGFIVRLVWPTAFQARTTPLEDVLQFKAEFESDYGAVHPTFYQGSYSQALNDAKRELRFLLVYLHSPEHQDTQEFCRSTMTNEGFREYVNGNMLFWAANVNSTEGYKVSHALREATYPFLAVICLRDNRMTVVGRMEGLMNVDGYVALLARLIEDNEPALVVARADRHERTQTQQLRDEQDEAYYESVRADQEKERKKREEEDKKRLEEESKRQKEEAKRNRAQSIAQDRLDRKLRIPEEPESSDPDSVRVLIKMPNGKRLERRFLKSHSLQALYDFVFCDEESPVEFVLVSNFPRKVYAMDCSSEDQTLGNAGIEANALLFVQNVENDSDSDSD
ncbi:FAS-associated factor 2 [Desmophyllum pertusum]|uniref:FAS-associated factor 2 n=1 Tax=Desmophyllum pertusum TaxID=174260 RepID=A0A9W9YPZ2_9CNID|nr:FAS-associated factor 2 [Desmophyllum pertusum]